MLILSIETSCDDTACSVFKGPREVLSSVVSSQEEVHRKYGGVVPELASRRHLENIVPVIKMALEEAKVELPQIEAVVATRGPGLPGSLFVGFMMAKAMAFALKVPFVGVNHLMGHLLAIFLEKEVEFPFIGLVVSGGHTSLYLVKGFLEYELLGETMDDAAGEAFDKVASLFGLPYPGGPIIDKLSLTGDPNFVNFPRPMLNEGLSFSFSGLKSAVKHLISTNSSVLNRTSDVLASFQEAVCDVLVTKALRAASLFNVKRIVLSGGVASNRRLREKFLQEGTKGDFEVYFPSPKFCTDNAAMIALAGYELLKAGRRDSWDTGILPRWPLGKL